MEEVSPERAAIGFKSCLICGEEQARKRKHCIVPLHKSNYMVVTSREELVGINNKGGQLKTV
jgi:hypothetical protein